MGRIKKISGAYFTAMAAWARSPRRAALATNHGTIVCADFRERKPSISYEWKVSLQRDKLSCICLDDENYITVGSELGNVHTLDQRTGRVVNSFNSNSNITQVLCRKNLILANDDPGLTVLAAGNDRFYGLSQGHLAVTAMPVDFQSQKCVFCGPKFFPFQLGSTPIYSHRLQSAQLLPLGRKIIIGDSTGLGEISI